MYSCDKLRYKEWRVSIYKQQAELYDCKKLYVNLYDRQSSKDEVKKKKTLHMTLLSHYILTCVHNTVLYS